MINLPVDSLLLRLYVSKSFSYKVGFHSCIPRLSTRSNRTDFLLYFRSHRPVSTYSPFRSLLRRLVPSRVEDTLDIRPQRVGAVITVE